MNLTCLYYKMAFKPKMEAGWFISWTCLFNSGRSLENILEKAGSRQTNNNTVMYESDNGGPVGSGDCLFEAGAGCKQTVINHSINITYWHLTALKHKYSIGQKEKRKEKRKLGFCRGTQCSGAQI